MSTEKLIKIKDLVEYEGTVTAEMARQAKTGALVEFHARAVAGFAQESADADNF